MCGSHSVSFGQYGLRYSNILTEFLEVRKGILEEGAAKTHWIKTEVIQRGYFRARDRQDIRLWPQRAAGPGWAKPQAAESWTRGRKLLEPSFPNQRVPWAWEAQPGKAALPPSLLALTDATAGRLGLS